MKWAAVAAVNVAAVLVVSPVFASLFLLHGVEDFSAFYTAGVIWHHFRGASLYDLHLQMEILRNLVGRAELPFYHPPYELLIFAPISLLPYRVALWCWRAVCVLALIPTSAMLARITDAKLSSRDVFLISVSFFPIMVCLLQGQDSILLLTIISASAFLYASGRDAQAGAVLAIGLFKFQFVLPIATILALRRKGRFTAGFVAAGSAIVAISIAMVRWEGAIQFIGLVHAAESSNTLGVSPVTMVNLHGLLSAIIKSGIAANLVTIALSLAIVIFVGLTRQPQPRSREFAAATCAAALVSFHMNPHDMAILLLPTVIVVAQLQRHQRFERLTALAFILTPVYLLFLSRSVFPFFAVLVAALLWILMRRYPSTSTCQVKSGDPSMVSIEASPSSGKTWGEPWMRPTPRMPS